VETDLIDPSSSATVRNMLYRSAEELEAGLEDIRAAPTRAGTVELIVRRPDGGRREILSVAELTLDDGVLGDNWNQRVSRRTEDGSPHPDMQLNVINARVSALVSLDPEHRALAGDQLHLDLDLSPANLPPGTRLALGSAIIEVTDQPHTGCAKFTERFGLAAHRWVNSTVGKELNLRGINARVVQPGTVRQGDKVTKLSDRRAARS
jgi:hypothetical protein